MTDGKTILFFPSPGAIGPTLNMTGIAQSLAERGHRPVFLLDPLVAGTAKTYGFEEVQVSCTLPPPPEGIEKMYKDFLATLLPSFRTSPYDQISSYVKTCLEATVDSACWAQKTLSDAFAQIKPDLIIKDNVLLYPATEMAGCPWVRIISCCETELADPDVPPFASGCRAKERQCFDKYMEKFTQVIKPTHDRFNEFVQSTGHPSLSWPHFQMPSPYLNLLLCPEPLRFHRRHPLDLEKFQYLDGCLRRETDSYTVPNFKMHNDKPLIYLSFGSGGGEDIETLKRLIAAIGKMPFRLLVNVGRHEREYTEIPDNVHVASWYKQIALIPHCDIVIQHGGNNTLNETLYHGKRPILMAYCWDGHDNATRIEDTEHGVKLLRYEWTEQQLASALDKVMTDETINENLARTSQLMQANDGRQKAAALIDKLLANSNTVCSGLVKHRSEAE